MFLSHVEVLADMWPVLEASLHLTCSAIFNMVQGYFFSSCHVHVYQQEIVFPTNRIPYFYSHCKYPKFSHMATPSYKEGWGMHKGEMGIK